MKIDKSTAPVGLCSTSSQVYWTANFPDKSPPET